MDAGSLFETFVLFNLLKIVRSERMSEIQKLKQSLASHNSPAQAAPDSLDQTPSSTSSSESQDYPMGSTKRRHPPASVVQTHHGQHQLAEKSQRDRHQEKR
jgi:hypothetical protein